MQRVRCREVIITMVRNIYSMTSLIIRRYDKLKDTIQRGMLQMCNALPWRQQRLYWCLQRQRGLFSPFEKKGQDLRYFLKTLSITNKLNVMQKAFNNTLHDNVGDRVIAYLFHHRVDILMIRWNVLRRREILVHVNLIMNRNMLVFTIDWKHQIK